MNESSPPSAPCALPHLTVYHETVIAAAKAYLDNRSAHRLGQLANAVYELAKHTPKPDLTAADVLWGAF